MGALDYFIGTVQSRYAGIAMFAAVIAISLMILLTDTEISIGNRIAIVFLMILMAAFPILISLFELTCIVTGGKKNSKYNLCHIFAWFVTVIIIIYCFMLIIAAVLSIFTYKKAIHKINTLYLEDANYMLEQFKNNSHENFTVSTPGFRQYPIEIVNHNQVFIYGTSKLCPRSDNPRIGSANDLINRDYNNIASFHTYRYFFKNGKAKLEHFPNYKGEVIFIYVDIPFILKQIGIVPVVSDEEGSLRGRPPGKFRIYAINLENEPKDLLFEGEWVLIHDQTNSIADYIKGESKKIDINNTQLFSTYALVVNELSEYGKYKSSEYDNRLNFAQWELYGIMKYPFQAMESDITNMKGIEVQCKATTNTWGKPYNLFNHNLTDEGTKSFHTNGGYNNSITNPGDATRRYFPGYFGEVVMINLGSPFVLNQIGIAPRSNRLKGRSPGKFRIYATNDVSKFNTPTYSGWDIIHDQTSLLTLTDYNEGESKKIYINNNNEYSIYALVVNKLVGRENVLNFAEWELYGNSLNKYPLRAMTSNITNIKGKDVICKASTSSWGEPYKLFNYNLTDEEDDSFHTREGYNSGNAKNTYFPRYSGEVIMINLGERFVLKKIGIAPRSDILKYRSPGMFRIYGTNDISKFDTNNYQNWDIIHDQTSLITDYKEGESKKIYINNNNKEYSIYALVVNKLAGGEGILNFAEWELYGKPNDIEQFTIEQFTIEQPNKEKIINNNLSSLTATSDILVVNQDITSLQQNIQSNTNQIVGYNNSDNEYMSINNLSF